MEESKMEYVKDIAVNEIELWYDPAAKKYYEVPLEHIRHFEWAVEVTE